MTWEPGKLTLAEGASIERAIHGGAWARVELELQCVSRQVTEKQAQLRLWFLFDGANPCFVRGTTSTSVSDPQTGTLALFRIREKDGKSSEVPVREFPFPSHEIDKLVVEYRHGLVSVTANGSTLLMAHVENGNATVDACRLETVQGRETWSAFSAFCAEPPKQLTEQQRQQLAEATAANQEMGRLYQQEKLAEAAKAGERAVSIRQSVLGEHHPTYAAALNNLAGMNHSVGNLTRAEEILGTQLFAVSLAAKQGPPTTPSLFKTPSCQRLGQSWCFPKVSRQDVHTRIHPCLFPVKPSRFCTFLSPARCCQKKLKKRELFHSDFAISEQRPTQRYVASQNPAF